MNSSVFQKFLNVNLAEIIKLISMKMRPKLNKTEYKARSSEIKNAHIAFLTRNSKKIKKKF